MPKRSDTKTPSQDTPGRAKPSSSRQQTQKDQTTHTGAPEIDKRSRGRDAQQPAREEAKVAYDDRPSRDGKHGDGHQQPNRRPT